MIDVSIKLKADAGNVSAAAKTAADALAGIGSTSKTAADEAAQAFKTLGIRASADIVQAAKGARAALNSLSSAGLGEVDMSRARAAARAQLAELRKEYEKFKLPEIKPPNTSEWRGAVADIAHLGTTFMLAGQGAKMLAGTVIGMTAPLVEAGLAAEKINRQLTFTTGSSAGAAREMEFLRNTTATLGINFNAAAAGYGKLAAASRGTVLEGKATRDVFEGIAKASVVLGMSTDETSGALMALQQMISKGSVQSEELKGQLGERLPGAFQIAARAMGVTTAELGKLLEAGMDVAEFMPKFSAELNRTFSGEAGSASASAQANINRMVNAWEDFKTSLANSGVLSVVSNAVGILAAGMDSINTGELQTLARLKKDLANETLLRNGEKESGEDTYYTDKRIENIKREINAIQDRARAEQEAARVKAESNAAAEAKARAAVPGAAWDSSSRESSLAKQYNPDRIKAAEDKRIKERGEFNKKYRSKNDELELEIARARTLFSGDELAAAEKAIREKLKVGAVADVKESDRAFKEAMDKARSYAAEIEGNAARYAKDVERLKEEAIQIEGGAQALARYQVEKLEAGAATYELSAGIYENAAAFAVESKAGGEAVRVYQRLAEAARDSAAALRDKATRTVANEGAKQAKKDYEEAEKAAEKAAKQAAADSSRAWEKFSDDIERSLTDALYRAFEKGGNFGKTFIDTLKNTLKSAVLKIVIQAVVDPITGGIKSLLGGGEDGKSGGTVSSALNISSTLSTLKTLWTNLVPIANGSYVANQFGSLANSEFGQTLGLSKATDIGADGKLIFELSESGASFDKIFNSTSFKSAAASFAGAFIGSKIAGEYRISDKVSMAQIGATIGNFIPGIGGFIGGIVGGIADRAFGRGPKKIKAQGIEGTFSGMEFEGRNFADWKQKGGWFRSSKRGTNYSAIDGAVKEMMGDAFASVKVSVGLLAQSLGAPTAAIAGYSKYIRQSLDENSFRALLDKMGDEMAAFALAGTDFAIKGETALVTLRRLSSSFNSVNTWLKRLQQTTLSVSVASGDAASQLLDLFGGLEKFTDAQVKYYDLFYSEQEKYNAMQLALAETFAALGLSVPNSKQAFKDLLASIDLTNAGGREAYKTLTDLAPTFAEAVVAIEAHAIEVAGKLLAAYTGQGALVPALSLIAETSDTAARDMTTSAGIISARFLDLASGLLDAGTDVGTLNTALTGNQLAAVALATEIDTIGINSRNAQVDIAGLSAELAKVDTATFVATIGNILQSIAKRFESILGAVARERVAVREAAIRILNPTPLTAAAIADSIAAATPNAPTRTALYTANDAVTAANATATAAIEKANAARATQSSAISGVEAGISNIWALASKWGVGLEDGAGGAARFDVTEGGLFDAVYNAIRYTVGQEWRPTGFKNEFYQAGGVYDQTYGQSGTLSALASNATAADAAAVAAANALASAQTTATKAQLDYVAALQTYAVNAEKSVATLGRLREETVRWYDEQKRIADLMKSIATGLRGTVEQIKFSQLSDAQKYATLDAQFNTAYSLALATTGETLAGYGDKLNSLLGPAIEAAQNALSGSEAAAYTATALARAEAIAGRLETLAPAAFEQTSLDLLGQIDASLLALESVSIETSDAVVDAIEASKELTAAGLRAIVAALTGEAVPAFAAGGYHDGGLRLVGEHGPELEATGASRIWSAADTRRIMQGGEKVGAGEAALLMELSALRAEVVALRAETRATAVNTGKSARFAERWDVDGLTVRNDADTPLITEAAA